MGNSHSGDSNVEDALSKKEKDNKTKRRHRKDKYKDRKSKEKNKTHGKRRRHSIDNENFDKEKQKRKKENYKNQMDGMMTKGRSETDLTELERSGSNLYPNYQVKRIGIYKSKEDALADNIYRHVVWNPKHYRNWDKFMEHLTDVVKPTNGPIERLFTPNHGSRVPNEFSAIEDKKNYIATSYMDSKIFPAVIDKPSKTSSSSSVSSDDDTSGMVSYPSDNRNYALRNELSNKPLVIFVYRNRDIYYKPAVVRLRKRELESMDRILNAIGEKVTLMSCTPIRRLYDLEGNLIRDGAELMHAANYVAAGLEKFYKLDYKNTDLLDFRYS